MPIPRKDIIHPSGIWVPQREPVRGYRPSDVAQGLRHKRYLDRFRMAVGYGTGTQWPTAHGGAVTNLSTGNGTIAGGDANTGVLCYISVRSNTVTISSVVLDPAGTNQALALVGSGVNTDATVTTNYLYGLVGPTAVTTVPVKVTLSAAPSSVQVTAAYFIGVNQVFASAFINVNSHQDSSNPTVTITTASGNATTAFACDNAASAGLAGTPFTRIWLDNTILDNGGNYNLSSGSSDVYSWTGSSAPWTSLGCCIVAAAAAGGGSKNLAAMGVG